MKEMLKVSFLWLGLYQAEKENVGSSFKFSFGFEGFEQEAQLIQADNPFTQIASSSREIPVVTWGELLTFEPQVIKRTVFKTEAIIDELDISDGWFYKACHLCNKKLNENENFVGCTVPREKGIPIMKIGLTKRAVEENSPTYKIYAEKLISEVQATDNIGKGKLPLIEDSVFGKLALQEDSTLEENDDETYNAPSSLTDSQVENDFFVEISPFKKMKKREEETSELKEVENRMQDYKEI
ncbi:hypothetical protein COLO4_02967 [Corchorus olitorius]|uniref:Nucleic acid-binding protein n=1 Tax=Corchorus olitorius TaxID=93759 RepID=A0A1R3KZS7_9ROSI|nr:hypothetical protein COLO4_02967 [Corchorus olitorius]